MSSEAIILVQARLSSSRLPGKCLRTVHIPFFEKPRPLMGFLLDNLVQAQLPIVLVVPSKDKNSFAKFLKKYRQERKKLQKIILQDSFFSSPLPPLKIFADSKIKENDVLSRFVKAAEKHSATHYIRVTGDNPFTCPHSLLSILKNHLTKKADLSFYHGLPYGAGVEVIARKTLFAMNTAHGNAREHLTTYVHKNPRKFSINSPLASKHFRAPSLRLTVDTEKDWDMFVKRLRRIYLPPKKAENKHSKLQKLLLLSNMIKEEKLVKEKK